MTDKQVLQNMRKMVLATHWIKGSLKRVLEYVKDPNDPTGYCRLENGQFKQGKVGHCLMGLVAVNTGHEVSGIEYELKQEEYKQASRITARLYKNLPLNFRTKDHNTTYQAFCLESFNDYPITQKEDIVALIDRAIKNK